MATQQEHTDHTNSTYSFTNITDFYKASEIKVKHVADDGTTTDPVSTSNVDTTNKEVTLSSAVTDGTITVYRETDLTGEDIEFQAGSSIKSVDLNKAQEVLRRGIEETREQETYQTGAEIKTAYEAQSNTNAYTDDEKSKLSGIATGAQTGTVTSVTGSSPITVSNGTTTPAISIDLSSYSTTSHNHDSSYNNYSISSDLLDEDDMASNSNTKVPSQQSVKAYVDANAGSGGIALTDISATSESPGTAALSYDNSSGVFSYTPPDLSGYSVTSHTHSYSAGDLTGTTLASGVTASSLTSVGELTSLTVNGDVLIYGNDSQFKIRNQNSTNAKFSVDTDNGNTYIDGNFSIEGNVTENVYPCTGTELNPDNGTIQYKTLGANTTLTESIAAGQSMLLMVVDGSSYEVTWPNMTWVGGYAPTLATSGYSCIELWKISSTLYGCYIGDVN